MTREWKEPQSPEGHGAERGSWGRVEGRTAPLRSCPGGRCVCSKWGCGAGSFQCAWKSKTSESIVTLVKRSVREDLITLYCSLKGGCLEVWVSLFSHITALGCEVMALSSSRGCSLGYWEKLILKRSGNSLEQAACRGDSVAILGSVRETRRCGT